MKDNQELFLQDIIVERLKTVRKELGLNKAEMSKALGINAVSGYPGIEYKTHALRIKHLMNLLINFNINPSYILGLSNMMLDVKNGIDFRKKIDALGALKNEGKTGKKTGK